MSPAGERKLKMNETQRLSVMLSEIRELTDEDIRALRKLILDYLAASCAGYSVNRRFNEQVESQVLPQGGREEATVFYSGEKLPAPKAAFMNSVYAHGAELDDGNRKAMGHIGVHVMPAVFALAEKLGSTEKDVLLALATGYEAYIRISSAAQPGMVKRGYHSTGMAGTPGCAAACARLYHLDAAGIENAIALATTMTGGLLSYGDSRPAIKPLNPAKAAESGMFAAMLAASGMEGPEEALEGPNGWFHAAAESWDGSYLERKPGGHLLLHECYFKLYPSCRHTHCGIEAGTVLASRVRAEEIEKVNVYIYSNAIKLAGITYPADADETKFSIAYTLACALTNGSYGVDDMKKAEQMPAQIRSLIARTELIPDETMEDREKGIRGAKVEVVLKNGTREEETVLIPKGDPEKPLSFEDIEKKLETCARGLADRTDLDGPVSYIREFGRNPERPFAAESLYFCKA